MDSVRLGLSMRALRRRRGWTQEHLADAAGVSRSVVQRVERGGAEDVTGHTLREIATALPRSKRSASRHRVVEGHGMKPGPAA